jgi:hypothetical protein
MVRTSRFSAFRISGSKDRIAPVAPTTAMTMPTVMPAAAC